MDGKFCAIILVALATNLLLASVYACDDCSSAACQLSNSTCYCAKGSNYSLRTGSLYNLNVTQNSTVGTVASVSIAMQGNYSSGTCTAVSNWPLFATVNSTTNTIALVVPQGIARATLCFIYTACNTSGCCSSATVVVNVLDYPYCRSNYSEFVVYTGQTLTLISWFIFIDSAGASDYANNITVVQQPSYGTLNLFLVSDQLQYSPGATYKGETNATLQACNSINQCGNCTVDFDVEEYQQHMCRNVTVTGIWGVTRNVSLSNVTVDTDDDSVALTRTAGSYGTFRAVNTLQNLASAYILYTPPLSYVATDTVLFTLWNSQALNVSNLAQTHVDNDTCSLTVDLQSYPSCVPGVRMTAYYGMETFLNVSQNITDPACPDPNTWSLQVTSPPVFGNITNGTHGGFNYTGTRLNGTDSFLYSVVDCDSLVTANCSVQLTVRALPICGTAPGGLLAIAGAYTPFAVTNWASDPQMNISSGTYMYLALSTNLTARGNLSLTCAPAQCLAFNFTLNYYAYSNQTGNDTLPYLICDAIAGCSQCSIDVLVIGYPVCQNDNYTIQSLSGWQNLTVLANDTSPNNKSLSVYNVVPSSGLVGNGTANGAYGIQFYPYPGSNGFQQFRYNACDIYLCGEAYVGIQVYSPPTCNATYVTAPNGTNVYNVCNWFTGFDNNLTTLAITGKPQHGNATLSANCSLVYTVGNAICVSDLLAFQVCDVSNDCTNCSVNVTIPCPSTTVAVTTRAVTTIAVTMAAVSTQAHTTGAVTTSATTLAVSTGISTTGALILTTAQLLPPTPGSNGSFMILGLGLVCLVMLFLIRTFFFWLRLRMTQPVPNSEKEEEEMNVTTSTEGGGDKTDAAEGVAQSPGEMNKMMEHSSLIHRRNQ